MTRVLVAFGLLSVLAVLGWIAANWGRPVDEEAEKQEYLDYLHARSAHKPISLSVPAAKGFSVGFTNDHVGARSPVIHQVSDHGYLLRPLKKETRH